MSYRLGIVRPSWLQRLAFIILGLWTATTAQGTPPEVMDPHCNRWRVTARNTVEDSAPLLDTVVGSPLTLERPLTFSSFVIYSLRFHIDDPSQEELAERDITLETLLGHPQVMSIRCSGLMVAHPSIGVRTGQ